MFIMKKKFFAIFSIACIILSSVLVPSAYDWPASPTNDTYVVSALSSQSVQNLAYLSDLMAEMNMIPQPYYPIAIITGGSYSSSSSNFQEYHLYVSRTPLTASVSGSTITYTINSSVPQGVPIFRYYFTETGWCLYVQSGSPVSFSSDRLVYSFVDVPDTTPWRGLNPSISFGSNNDSVINNLYQEYVDLFNLVDNYEESILEAESIAYETGYVNGSADAYPGAYSDGYSDGLSDGFDTGYSDGFSSGYSSGLSIGQASGLQQGRQEGYDTGYSEGFQDGLETGYLSGKSDGYIQGNQEGYQVGLTQGRQEGYETGFDDGFESGFDDGFESGFDDGYETGFDDGYETGYSDGLSDGGGSGVPDPIVSVRLIFRKGIKNENGSVDFLGWDGSDLNTLVFDTATGLIDRGYVVYTTFQDFYSSQLEVPSSINFSVPDIIREKFGFNFGLVDDYQDFDDTAYVDLFISDYDLGFNSGFQDGANIIDGLGSIASAPVSSLLTALDFEIFGLHVGWTILGIIGIMLCLIGWKIIKKFIPV